MVYLSLTRADYSESLALLSTVTLSLKTAQYLAFAGLALGIWDWLLNLSDECDIFRASWSRRGWSWRSVGVMSTYIVCRFASVGYAIITVFLSVDTFSGSCFPIGLWTCIFYGVSAPATALLFYFRVTAVYFNNKPVIAFFTMGWLAVVGCFGYDAYLGVLRFAHPPGSSSCGVVVPPNGKIDSSSYVSIAAYDTMVYLAISWRLSSHQAIDSHWTARFASFFSGTGLYRLSKTLLRDGQIYYL
ncbi:hypothetical protein FIBSPDRAFT_447434 [Athelia psychrophila]|uniref:DUF6533 domain-containing protein n=1 Tax=Athelia psychrophila TaxID=1759441 RepID=A0A166MBU9_9AGAM|nr:hypothetical protein FIBSPDRAFT_447434 [Fibularhizoctonia sp. CBS 109695]